MPSRKRTSVHLDPGLHRALRLKARATDCTISEVVGDALRQVFAREALTIERSRGPAVVRPGAMALSDVGARLKRRPKT
jgi:hypothetical protein